MGLDSVIQGNSEYINVDRKLSKNICYWRNSWNLRDAFLSILDDEQSETLHDCGEIYLNIVELRELYQILKSYSKNPKERGYDCKDLRRINRKNKRHLKTLVKLKNKYPSITIMLIDSY